VDVLFCKEEETHSQIRTRLLLPRQLHRLGFRRISWKHARLTIARSHLIHILGTEEKALGDKAYVGNSHFIAPYRPAITEDQKEWNKYHQVRQKIERVIKRVKQFGCVREVWRHSLEWHPIVFLSVASLQTSVSCLNLWISLNKTFPSPPLS